MRSVVFLFLLFVKFSHLFSQTDSCADWPAKNGGVWTRFESYNPYTWSYISSGVVVQKFTADCTLKYTYIFNAAFDVPHDSMIVTIDRCNPKLSQYEYFIRHHDYRFPDTPYIKGTLLLVDKMVVKVDGAGYALEKYRAVLSDSQNVTLYISDTLGLVKQYASFRSLWDDNIELEFPRKNCFQAILIKEFLHALYESPEFHERFDYGPRTIGSKVIDRKIYKKTKRMYKKKGLI